MVTFASKADSAGSTSTASRPLLGLLVAVTLVVTVILAACSGDSARDPAVAQAPLASTATVPDPAPDPPATAAPGTAAPAPGNALRPGNNQPVVVGRGDRLDTHFQAAVYLRLLRELGYRADYFAQGDGAGLLAPAPAYQALADGRIDVWPGGIFPQHVPFLADPVAGGGGDPVSNRVSVVGEQILGGIVEGVLVSRDWASANGVAYLDDIAADAALAADFDVDGDGAPDIYGCPAGTTCQILLDRLIDQNNWPFQQITAGVNGSILDVAVDRIGLGQPTLVFGRSPGESLARLAPGVATVWLSVAAPVDEQSNDANLDARLCPASRCNTGFPAADILAVANIEFLNANPPARALLDSIKLTAADVSQQNLGIDETTSAADVDNDASRWITEHRELVNQWLEAARAAN